jgi:ABC-type glutathione transport system ATPase component
VRHIKFLRSHAWIRVVQAQLNGSVMTEIAGLLLSERTSDSAVAVASGDGRATAAPTEQRQTECSSRAWTFNWPTGSFVAVTDIDSQIRTGEFVCNIGPSGCSKSTLLNTAAEMLTPNERKASHPSKLARTINTGVGYKA